MPLEETVETLDKIDEKYHDLYVENDDGKFEINITGLKSALTKERKANKLLEKKLNKKSNDDPDVEALKLEIKTANSTIKNMKMLGKIKSAALSAGVEADCVDDVLTLTKGNFGINDEGQVVTVDADGEATGKSLSNYFNGEFKKNKPRYYSGSGKSGGGSQSNLNSDGTLSYSGKIGKAITDRDLTSLVQLKQGKIKQ